MNARDYIKQYVDAAKGGRALEARDPDKVWSALQGMKRGSGGGSHRIANQESKKKPSFQGRPLRSR